jgi:hypothetical protein
MIVGSGAPGAYASHSDLIANAWLPAPLVWLDRDDVLITHCGANLQVLFGSSNREQLLPEIHCQLPIGSTAPVVSAGFGYRAHANDLPEKNCQKSRVTSLSLFKGDDA